MVAVFVFGLVLVAVGMVVAKARGEFDDAGLGLPPCYRCGHHPVEVYKGSETTYECGCGFSARDQDGRSARENWKHWWGRRA